MSWPLRPIGEFLTESAIESPSPSPERRIRVKLNADGVEKRPLLAETEGATKYFIRRAGQFIYGKQNLHKGAFGVVPPELDGFESSGDLPAFDVADALRPEWLVYYLKQGAFYRSLVAVARGAATKRIQPKDLFLVRIPVPSLEVQDALIGRMHLATQKCAAAEREIAHQEDLVAKLKQAILQEAITGRLTPGWRAANPKVEPASQLLARIGAQKARLVAAKKLRHEKPLPKMSDSEIPFALPVGWEWCRFGDVLEHTFYGPRFGKDEYVGDGIPTIRTTDMSGGSLDLLPDVPRVKLNDAKKVRLYELRENDILITRTGSIGVMALFPGGYQAFPSAYLIRCRLMEDSLGFYVFKVLQAPLGQDHLGLNTKTGTRPNINSDSIVSIPLPLPPLAEQKEIVARVESLMERCRELEAEIARSRACAKALLQAVLREAFAPVAAA